MYSNVPWRRTAAVFVACAVGAILSLGTGQVRHALRVYPPTPPILAAAAPASRCEQPVLDLGPTHPLPLSKIRYFAYQIQGLRRSGAVDALVNSRYDLMVVDPTRTDWSYSAADFDTRGMVARLKRSKASDGAHRKLVIAYIDIGEAENWRWYWTWRDKWENVGPRPEVLPTFILGHDPDGWGENFPVAYWDQRWKDIVIYGRHLDLRQFTERKPDFVSVLDEVIKDGFDGVYLDWVEGFSHPPVVEEARRQGLNPADEMVTFIQELRDYAAARVPRFLTIQQNGSALARRGPDIFRKVDAIAQEEVWYDGRATDKWDDPSGYDHPVDPATTADLLRNLKLYQNACVPVFNVEYALNLASDAYAKSYARGYVPYVTRRSLGALTTTPPPDYLKTDAPK